MLMSGGNCGVTYYVYSLLKSGTSLFAPNTFRCTYRITASHFAPEANPEYLSDLGK